jgi:Trypsin-like peptidase domain/NACHT domain
MPRSLAQLLQQCTVQLVPSESKSGTGFFVSRDRILTCAHVVGGESEIEVRWQGKVWAVATVEQVEEDVDLALLQVDLPGGEQPPYVLMNQEFSPFDPLYVYGYPVDFPEGGSVTTQCEGTVRERGRTLIKVQAGLIQEGHSGSPGLNCDTGKVCGIVSDALTQGSRRGGLLVPVNTVFEVFPQLRSHHQEASNPDHPWFKHLTQQAASSEQEVLERYLKQQIRRYRVMRLPLLSSNAESIPLHIETLYIDLPLRETPEVEVANEQHRREGFASQERINRELRERQISRQKELCRIGQQLEAGVRLAVVGDPGCGKTTLQSFLAYSYACRQLPADLQDTMLMSQRESVHHEGLPDQPWIPVTLICRDLLEADFNGNLVDLLQYQLQQDKYSRSDRQLLVKLLEKRMTEGKILLLIDGLDEIPAEKERRKFVQTITSQANIYYSRIPIVLTSRVVGFSSVQTLLDSFKHFTVAPLGSDEREQFVWAWARYVSRIVEQEVQTIVNDLETLISESREVTRLSENIFLLVLIAQILLQDGQLSSQKEAIYRRAVKLMIERRQGLDELPLSVNEVCPHLEYLAYQMRSEGQQRWSETKVLQAIEQVRRDEADAIELQQRHPQEMLNLVVDRSGLLNIAGVREDERGFERRVIQFFHQSFQEYFAAQALLHRRGVSESEVLSELCQKISGLTVVERKIEFLGRVEKTELVVGDQWQEVVRFSISSLSGKAENALNRATADEAILMLLPAAGTPAKEARALSVFALQTLVEVPDLKPETVRTILDTTLDYLDPLFDGFNTVQNTLMDEAWYSAMHSCFEPLCRERLLKRYVQSSDIYRQRTGSVYAMAVTSDEMLNATNAAQILEPLLTQLDRASLAEERIDAGLKLLNAFYHPQSKNAQLRIDFLPDRLLQKAAQFLLKAAIEEPKNGDALSSVATWALAWLTSAKSDAPYTTYIFSEIELNCLRQLAIDDRRDAFTRVWSALILSSCRTEAAVFTQADWIYDWAVIADGGKPHKELAVVTPLNYPGTIEVLRLLLASVIATQTKQWVAIALGRLGYFTSEMVEPLALRFLNDLSTHTERDEALVYLVLTGGETVRSLLLEGANQPNNEQSNSKQDLSQYDLPSRFFLAILAMGDVEMLRYQLNLGRGDQMDVGAYAYALAGVENPEGRKILESMKHHPQKQVRDAVLAALSKVQQWNVPADKRNKLSSNALNKATALQGQVSDLKQLCSRIKTRFFQ